MNEQAFRFNSDVTYPAGGVYPQSAPAAKMQFAQPSIAVAREGAFQIRFLEVFQAYRLPNVSSDTLVQAWFTSPMQFWRNQNKFAVWCATAGCGVSAQDHL